MKRIVILFIAVITATSAHSQAYLQDGDLCFDSGDYACAITNYDRAFRNASGEDEQNIADMKRLRAENCSIWLQSANQAFNNKDYALAKENYLTVLDSNPKDSYAKEQLEKCNNFFKPATTLSVSKEKLSYSSTGGNENITVATNVSSYSISTLPSWCTVQKYPGYFTVTCNTNAESTARSGDFTVTAGDKIAKINVSQAGSIPKLPETTLSVTKKSISFSSSGGKSETIRIYSNAPTYSVSVVPSWCTVQRYSGYIIVTCNANYGSERKDFFTIQAGDKSMRIDVTQSGTSKANSNTYSSGNSNRHTSYKKKKCFNCPNTKYAWGISLGYVEKGLNYPIINGNYGDYSYYEELEGIQLGLRYEPLFKYGFGLNTGIFYEYYTLKLFDENYNHGYDYEEYFLRIPFHLEYRFNFSKYFNLFVFGGLSAGVLTNNDSGEYSFQSSHDYGGGIRIDHFQINIGQSIRKNKSNDLIISCSYMF